MEQVLNSHNITECLNAFLGRLPKRTRIVFVKRYWNMEPTAQIAQECGIKENSVRSMLNRTRQKLRKYLEKEDIEL